MQSSDQVFWSEGLLHKGFRLESFFPCENVDHGDEFIFSIGMEFSFKKTFLDPGCLTERIR
jgi:hypothetical protein